HHGRRRHDAEPPGRSGDHDDRVEDQLLRRRPRGRRARGVDAAPSRQAHDGVADACHGRDLPAALAHDPDPDGVDVKIAFAGAFAYAYGHEVGIAEYVVGAMLALTRELGRLDAALRRSVWESQWAIGVAPPAPWPELAGKTLGILGYGRIGQCLAQRARAFDMTVLATRRSAAPSDGLATLGGPETLADVLTRADYLAITMPLTPETRGLIGARELASMKRTAMLVNPARAEIVEEDALYQALADRQIAGAALDVWYRYPSRPGAAPPAHRPFHELPNVLMTPHVSGWTEGMLDARAKLIADNVSRVARGESPLNLIT